MKSKLNNTQEEKTIRRINKIRLPLIALSLDFLPIIFVVLGLRVGLAAVYNLLTLLLPVAGLITGVIYLSRGKDKISKLGKILAIIAIALPLSVVTFIILFFIGVTTGIISLM